MATYRKKPVVIEAVQWTGRNYPEIVRFCAGTPLGNQNHHDDSFIILTLEGNHRASKGDWIIKGVKGEFYPCKPDIFEVTYEKVEA